MQPPELGGCNPAEIPSWLCSSRNDVEKRVKMASTVYKRYSLSTAMRVDERSWPKGLSRNYEVLYNTDRESLFVGKVGS
jgi:hypothetical protein